MSTKPARSHLPRKLLVAAIGVATINYVPLVACGGSTDSGNAGDSGRESIPPTSGNLPTYERPDTGVPGDAASEAGEGGDAASDAGEQDSGDGG